MNEKTKKISELLQEPFDSVDLEWRVQSCGAKQSGDPWVRVIPYVTNRAIQQRLDDVLGFDCWQNEYKPAPNGNGFLCGISVFINNQWVTKWDGAENTAIEPLKGGLSGSMKRAAVQLGIGRYLYNLEAFWATCFVVNSKWDADDNHAKYKDKASNRDVHINWANPSLPNWALPSVIPGEYFEKMSECLELHELKDVFAEAFMYAKSFGRTELQDTFTNAYNRQKSEIDEAAKARIETAYKSIFEHVQKQMKTLKYIPEASSVGRVCDTMIDHINKVSEGEYYDTKPLIELVEKSKAHRVQEITNNQETLKDE